MADNVPSSAPTNGEGGQPPAATPSPRVTSTGAKVTARKPKYDPTPAVLAAVEATRARRRIAYDDAIDPLLTNKALSKKADALAFEGPHMVNDARYEDIARRLWMQQSVTEIATAHGLSSDRMRAIMRDPAMIAAYLRVKAELFSNLDKVLFDEAAAPLLRARMQATRAQTLLSEVIEAVRERMSSTNGASATMMKVGVEAAFGIMDRSGGELALRRGGGVQVNVHAGGSSSFRDGTEALIRNTIAEAGLDLSDLARPTTIDVDATGE